MRCSMIVLELFWGRLRGGERFVVKASDYRIHLNTIMASASGAAAACALMPTLYYSHGGGPCFHMPATGMFAEMSKGSPFEVWYRTKATKDIPKPRAILVISAHWSTGNNACKVTTGAKPELLFDYYGFPPETYQLSYPAPGDPALAARIIDLLTAGGIAASGDDTRAWDHGVFIPLIQMYPNADVPVVQLSLQGNLDAKTHLAIGRALAPLRREGVLILGSGQTTHNMRAMGTPGGAPARWAQEFDTWLRETLLDANAPADGGAKRAAALEGWQAQAPNAAKCHPRGGEEHFAPLFVATGAAGGDLARVVFEGWALQTFSLSCFRFGN